MNIRSVLTHEHLSIDSRGAQINVASKYATSKNKQIMEILNTAIIERT